MVAKHPVIAAATAAAVERIRLVEFPERRSTRWFENAPISILVLDLARHPVVIVEANHRAQTLFGGMLAGSLVTGFIHEDCWARIQMLLCRLRPQETITVEATQRHRDGSSFAGRVHAMIDPDNPNQVILAVDDMGSSTQRLNPTQIPPGVAVEVLTDGEMDVLRKVAQGVDNKDIAKALHASPHTVANRLRTIYEKLSVRNRTQAALYALRQGWAQI